jgi:hypothetical protein
MYKSASLVFLLAISNVAQAASTLSCVPVTLKSLNKNIILSGDENPHTTQIYFVKNISKQSLWIDHPVEHRSANAGWSSYFQPGKWSVLLTNRKEFELSCAVIQPGKVDYQACEKVISVCASPQVTFDSKRKGSYWLAEDKSWEDLLSALEKRGVKFGVKNTEKKVIK